MLFTPLILSALSLSVHAAVLDSKRSGANAAECASQSVSVSVQTIHHTVTVTAGSSSPSGGAAVAVNNSKSSSASAASVKTTAKASSAVSAKASASAAASMSHHGHHHHGHHHHSAGSASTTAKAAAATTKAGSKGLSTSAAAAATSAKAGSGSKDTTSTKAALSTTKAGSKDTSTKAALSTTKAGSKDTSTKAGASTSAVAALSTSKAGSKDTSTKAGLSTSVASAVSTSKAGSKDTSTKAGVSTSAASAASTSKAGSKGASTTSVASIASSASLSSSAALASSTSKVSNSTVGIANPGSGAGANSTNPQTSFTIDPKVVQANLKNDGQDIPAAGQVPSLTSPNNFVNFCLTQKTDLTNGLQVKTGSCNPIPMGRILATTKLPSSKFVFPKNMDTIPANKDFTIQMAIKNLATGSFVNAQTNYYNAPAQVDASGTLIGHSHVVIEQIDSLASTTLTDPTKFTFFKGLNAAAVGGILTADVTGGLPPAVYRMSSINAAANHQPALGSVAQHGTFDDWVYFTCK